MGMLHPRFNHLGRSKKRKGEPSKKLAHAKKLHEAWLERRGLPNATARTRLKGAVPLDNAADNRRQPVLAPTSDRISYDLIDGPNIDAELEQDDE